MPISLQAMRLGAVLLRQRPSVLISDVEGRPLLELLLGLGLAAMGAQHRGLCEDVLEWTKAAVAEAVRNNPPPPPPSPRLLVCPYCALGLPSPVHCSTLRNPSRMQLSC